MHLVHRLSLVRPSIRLATVLAVALFAGLVSFQLTADAAAARSQFGETLDVVVMMDDVAGGAPIRPRDLAIRSVPASLVPDGALRQIPVGVVLRADGRAREVLLADDVIGGRSGPSALIPSGWRGVAVPTLGAMLPVRVGDLVDVVASHDPFVESARPTSIVATSALVIHVAEDVVTVAVRAESAPALAEALVTAAVSLLLVG